MQGLTWPARRTARGATAGLHRSRLRGPAPEFSEYRLYRQGDDLRRLDWKLLARTERAFLRLAEDRAVLGTLLVVDGSASMAYPEGPRSKWQVAGAVALGLAACARAGGDPVGLVVGDRVLPPRTRRGILGEMAQAFAVAPGGTWRVPDAPWPRRVAVVSDFLDAGAGLTRRVAEHVAAGGEAYAAHVVAREELDPPGDALLAVDPEEPSVRRALGPDTRAAYRAAFDAWRASIAARWHSLGAVYHECTTDEDPATVVRRIVRRP